MQSFKQKKETSERVRGRVTALNLLGGSSDNGQYRVRACVTRSNESLFFLLLSCSAVRSSCCCQFLAFSCLLLMLFLSYSDALSVSSLCSLALQMWFFCHVYFALVFVILASVFSVFSFRSLMFVFPFLDMLSCTTCLIDSRSRSRNKEKKKKVKDKA